MDIGTYTDKLAAQIQDLPNQMSKLLDSASQQAQDVQKSVQSESGSKASAGSSKKDSSSKKE